MGTRVLVTVIRRPPFGRHGQKVVAFLCTWEVLALPERSPLPTLSEMVDRHHWFGWLLLALLGHHWFVELEGAVLSAVDTLAS